MGNKMKTKGIRFFALICVACGILASLYPGTTAAQNRSDLLVASVSGLNEGDSIISLEDFLAELEKNYEVNFFYQHHIINNKYINLNQELLSRSENKETGQIVAELLKQLGIKYERMDEQTYILFQNEATRSNFKKLESISGAVTDAASGDPLPGVNVVVKGTTTGTSTNSNGEYQLTVQSLQDTLVFSFIGYQSREVAINGRTNIDISLQSQAISGEELVVVGYGTVSQENLTSSVKRVTSDEFVQGNVTDPAQLLKGKVAGLSINKVGSNPAETSQLKLRGTGTLVGDQSPLVIIDGVEGSLNDVSTQDIESINVIKDASAAAIYGTRGNNGVVVIETKRAEQGSVQLTYDGYTSTQQLTDEIPVLNAQEYRELMDQGIDEAVDFGSSTFWPDEVMRDMPVSHEHNLNISAGNEQTSYVANINYKAFEGIMQRSDNNTLDARLRVDHTMLDGDLDVTGSINVSKNWRYDGVEGGGSFTGRVLKDIYAFNPTRPIFNEDGSYNDNADNNTENPVSLIRETNGEFQESRANLFGTIVYSPVENLSLKAQGSRFTTDALEGFSRTKQHVIDLRDGTNGYASRSANKSVQHVVDLTAEYNSSFRDHDYSVLGGYTWKQTQYEDFFANNWDFPSDEVKYNNLSDGLALSEGQTTTDSFKQQTNLMGYFFRVNYDYKNKYILMASFRREGSSKFGTNQKWGNFPAASIGWNITSEPFMENIEFLNNLKVRFGYGRTGSEPTDPYLSLSRLSFGDKIYSNGQWISTIQPLNNSNPNLKWEEKEEYNLGVDFTILDQRLEGTVDLYRRETSDLLFNFTVPTPPFLFNTILANAGTITNEGVEVNLSATPVQDTDFNWTSTITYATNRNELTSLSNDQFSIGGGFFDTGYTGAPIQQQTHRVQVGRSIGNFYGFKTIGVTESGEWLIEGADGEPKSIADQVPEDKQYVGNGVPDHQLSWSNTFRYKNWDLDVLMRGAFGFQVANLRRMFFNVPSQIRGGNVIKGTFDPLYGERPLSIDQDKQYVSHFITDGDFWKIDSITLGYNFDMEESSALQDIRLYASTNNLFTITNYEGFDPEVNFSGLAPGMDDIFRFPSARSFTLGVSFSVR